MLFRKLVVRIRSLWFAVPLIVVSGEWYEAIYYGQACNWGAFHLMLHIPFCVGVGGGVERRTPLHTTPTLTLGV